MNGYLVLAELVVLVHAGFIAFVAFGALVARRRPWLRRLHLGAAAYAVAVSMGRWICPLTDLEYWLRVQGGEAPDGRAFLSRLLEPVVYADLPQGVILTAAVLVLATSLALYRPVWPFGRRPGR